MNPSYIICVHCDLIYTNILPPRLEWICTSATQFLYKNKIFLRRCFFQCRNIFWRIDLVIGKTRPGIWLTARLSVNPQHQIDFEVPKPWQRLTMFSVVWKKYAGLHKSVVHHRVHCWYSRRQKSGLWITFLVQFLRIFKCYYIK